MSRTHIEYADEALITCALHFFFFFFFKTIYIPVQPKEETPVDTHINGVSKSKVT